MPDVYESFDLPPSRLCYSRARLEYASRRTIFDAYYNRPKNRRHCIQIGNKLNRQRDQATDNETASATAYIISISPSARRVQPSSIQPMTRPSHITPIIVHTDVYERPKRDFQNSFLSDASVRLDVFLLKNTSRSLYSISFHISRSKLDGNYKNKNKRHQRQGPKVSSLDVVKDMLLSNIYQKSHPPHLLMQARTKCSRLNFRVFFFTPSSLRKIDQEPRKSIQVSDHTNESWLKSTRITFKFFTFSFKKKKCKKLENLKNLSSFSKCLLDVELSMKISTVNLNSKLYPLTNLVP